MSQGTPSNLFDAIWNGLNQAEFEDDNCSRHDKAESTRKHVKDFLAQKFQVAKIMAAQGRFSTENDLQILFDSCTKTSTCLNKE